MVNEFWSIYDRFITRPGAAELKRWLLTTDIAAAPASTRYHEAYPGGLAEHSVKVFHELCRLVKAYPEIKIPAESVAVVALLHDVCKLNSYATEMRNKKNEEGRWVQVPYYTFKEQFSFGGHGSKSVYLIQKYMQLTDEEAAAINTHMGANGDNSVFDAHRQFPLAFLLHTADMAATIPAFGRRA